MLCLWRRGTDRESSREKESVREKQSERESGFWFALSVEEGHGVATVRRLLKMIGLFCRI